MNRDGERVKMVLAAPGLGRTQRGAESFSAECFLALRDEPLLDLVLAHGAGPRLERAVQIPTLAPDSASGIRIGSRLGANGCSAEVWSFAAGLAPRLLRRRPRVVLVNDLLLARVLHRWGSLSRLTFRLILRNNTAGFRPPFPEATPCTSSGRHASRRRWDAGEPAAPPGTDPLGPFPPGSAAPGRPRCAPKPAAAARPPRGSTACPLRRVARPVQGARAPDQRLRAE